MVREIEGQRGDEQGTSIPVAEKRGNAMVMKSMSNEFLSRNSGGGRSSAGCIRGAIILLVGLAVLVAGVLALFDRFKSEEPKEQASTEETGRAPSDQATEEAGETGLPSSDSIADLGQEAALRQQVEVLKRDLAKAEEALKVSEARVTELEKKDPLPATYLSRRTIDTVDLWNGINVESGVTTEEGMNATRERDRSEGFQLGIASAGYRHGSRKGVNPLGVQCAQILIIPGQYIA